MKKVNRQEIFKRLQMVSPGLATREIQEQSSCFVFIDGDVVTFNEEVACRITCDLGVEKAAVAGDKLLEVLGKIPEETVDVSTENGCLLFKGKGRSFGLAMEEEIVLPIQSLEVPQKWKQIPDGFLEAVKFAVGCTLKQSERFCLTCINIHPDYIEACDNFQLMRYPIKTGTPAPTLVAAEAIKHIIKLDVQVVEYSFTKVWLHFKTAEGLIYSCRRYEDTYPSLNDLVEDTGGEELTLPGSLLEAVGLAEVFSKDNPDSDSVMLQIKENRLGVKGESGKGWYKELKKVSYNGPPISFMILPRILEEICKNHSVCTINNRRLRVDNGKFHYVTLLGELQ